MTTDLALREDFDIETIPDYDEEVAKALGLSDGFEGVKDLLPKLRINKDFDDDDGNALPPGTFHLRAYKEDADGNSSLVEGFGKEAQFRIFANFYQIIHYDPEAKNERGGKGVFVNKTIKVPNYNVEMRDELGGLRCGKIRSKDKDNYSEEEQKLDGKLKKTYRFLYGLVKLDDAVDRKGNKVEIDWTPCLLRVRGVNYIPSGEVLDAFSKKRVMAYNYVNTLSLTRHKNGDVVYYTINWNTDWQNPVKANKEDGELMLKFYETIKAENTEVEKKYTKAHAAVNADIEATNIINGLENGQSLENDFSDDVSDIGVENG